MFCFSFSGKVATPEIAQTVHEQCRSILKEMYGEKVANKTRILYGGSVSPESVDGLMAKPDIDGTLVGGASLSSEKFGRIINYIPVDSPVLQVSENTEERLGKVGRFKNSLRRIFRKA